MEPAKILREGFKVVKNRMGFQEPVSVTFSISTVCNLNCSYCYLQDSSETGMSTEKIKKMLEALSESGIKRINLTGGEPLLREDIAEIVNFASEKGMSVSLCSNGELPEKLEELGNLDILQLSLDGGKETHESLRKGSSFEKVRESMDIADEKDIDIITSTVLTKKNLDEIERVLKIAEEKGAGAYFMPLNMKTKQYYPEGMFPEREEIAEAMEKLLELKKEGYPVFSSKTTLRFIRDNWPDQKNQECSAGESFFFIYPNGRITACGMTESEKFDILEQGAERCFQQMDNPDCAGCWCPTIIENNMINQLRFEPVLNALNNLKD